MNPKLALFVLGMALLLAPGFLYAREVCVSCDTSFQCDTGLICQGGNPATPEEEGSCQYTDSTKVVICNPLQAQSFTALIDTILKIIFNIALAIVPLMVVIGGFMFVSAGGKPEQIAKARNLLLWTVVGFIVILSARGLTNIIKQLLNL